MMVAAKSEPRTVPVATISFNRKWIAIEKKTISALRIVTVRLLSPSILMKGSAIELRHNRIALARRMDEK
jgi:hypothetical protein